MVCTAPWSGTRRAGRLAAHGRWRGRVRCHPAQNEPAACLTAASSSGGSSGRPSLLVTEVERLPQDLMPGRAAAIACRATPARPVPGALGCSSGMPSSASKSTAARDCRGKRSVTVCCCHRMQRPGRRAMWWLESRSSHRPRRRAYICWVAQASTTPANMIPTGTNHACLAGRREGQADETCRHRCACAGWWCTGL